MLSCYLIPNTIDHKILSNQMQPSSDYLTVSS